jgi:hypothetical protein
MNWLSLPLSEEVWHSNDLGPQDGGQLPLDGAQQESRGITRGRHTSQAWSVNGWHWAFDGNFQRQTGNYNFEIEVAGVGDRSTPTTCMAWQKQ